MAKLPSKTTIVEFNLADGVGRAILRAPSIEEQNAYVADRLRVPDGADKDNVVQHFQEARARFFDLLLERFEDLEDEAGQPLTPERKGEVPASWKSEAIARKFDLLPVNVKN